MQKQFPGKVHLMQRPGKMGLASAYCDGFRWAQKNNFHTVCEMDADLSHRPEDLKRIVTTSKDHDVVCGSRYVANGGTVNWGIFRQIISRFGSLYAKLILGTPINDMTGGFNAWKVSLINRSDLNTIQSEGYSFQIEMKYRAHLLGGSIKEIPIIFVERRAGQSKMSWQIAFEAFYRVWLLRFKQKQLCD